MKIETVTIVGGTHGNEYTGVYLLKRLRRAGLRKRYKDLRIDLLLANPKAYEKGVRFIDHDLNRAFQEQDLADLSLSGYEANRAKAIHEQLGPKRAPKTDCLIDVHTSTANMGLTIIVADLRPFTLKMAATLQARMPGVFLYHIPPSAYGLRGDLPFLISLAPCGIMLEIGPIANGVVRHDRLLQAEQATLAALDFIHAANAGKMPATPKTIELYEHRGAVLYPMDSDGKPSAVIHEALQDRDFQPLKKGDPIFMTLDGKTLAYKGRSGLAPVFINEAAYYYKRTAFSLVETTTVALRP